MKYFNVLILFLITISMSFAVIGEFSCEWRMGSCDVGEKFFFAGNGNVPYYQGGNVISSPVNWPVDSNYNQALCCKIEGEESEDPFIVSIEPTGSACSQGKSVLYFTDKSQGGAKVAINYNPTHHIDQLCTKLPEEFSSMDIDIATTSTQAASYSIRGYKCISRMSGPESGLVGDCNEEDAIDYYNYSMWARVYPSLSALRCTADCYSSIDDRVYAACADSIAQCKDIPDASTPNEGNCDGSIYGGWVPVNETHEQQCSAPWNKIRARAIQDVSVAASLKVESQSDDCPNLISQKFNVFYNNQPIVMKIFVCAES